MSDFAGLYEEHHEGAHRYACTVTRNWDDAEDIVAESFGRVFARMATGFVPDEFMAYLCTTIRSRWAEYCRRGARRQLAEDGYWAATDAAPELAADPTAAGDVARTMSRLTPAHQWVLWHTAVEGLTPTEVAEEFGGTPNAVAAHAHRARVAFRHAWADPMWPKAGRTRTATGRVAFRHPWQDVA
jgi:RNA polymerase sigma factor (sigma-70 family)